jgi:hypothetical protein
MKVEIGDKVHHHLFSEIWVLRLLQRFQRVDRCSETYKPTYPWKVDDEGV